MAQAATWSAVINDADDLTAQLILKLQLEDIKGIEKSTASDGGGDAAVALRLFKAELQHHRALRTAEDEIPEAAVGEPVTTIMTFSCVVCEEKFDADHCRQAPCEHYYCFGHLEELFRLSLTDRTLFPPRCCRKEIDFDDVRLFLSDELVRQFESQREELSEKKRTYCHDHTCSTYIGAAHKTGPIGTCPNCTKQTCVLCGNVLHEGDCPPDEADRQTEALATEQGWRRCPDCRSLVELTIGCNHMTLVCPCTRPDTGD